MAKVILMCGKICSGKSTYAHSFSREHCAALLSVDEIMLAIFGQDAGDKHDDYFASLKEYLYIKSTELVEVGINVVLDIGLWTKAEREAVRSFFHSRNIPNEIHYLDISEAEWERRIEKRNREISENNVSAYYIDEGLRKKADAFFERPDPSEVDAWISI